MTVIVTRNVSPRIRGFLASSMLEVAPGIYTGPQLSVAVRERIWNVLTEWFPAEYDAGIVMIWREPRKPGGQEVKVLGVPPVDLIEHDGIILTRRNLSKPEEEDN